MTTKITTKAQESFFAEPREVALSDDGKGKEFELLRVGEFRHPDAGLVKITAADLKALKDSFDAHVRKIDLAINYEHGLSLAHGTKAAGWIRGVELKNGGTELWVTPEWTPEGLKAVKDKEFRYSSAEILWSYVDNETGKKFDRVLKGAALTNVPVIKGMEALAASEKALNQQKGKKTMNMNELKAECQANGIDLSELQKKAGDADRLSGEVSKLSETLKAESAKVAGLESKLSETSAKLTEAASKVEAAEKAQREMKFSELVKKGMAEGKLTKVMAEGSFRKVFDSMGVEAAESMLSEMAKVVSTEFSGHGNDAPATDGKKPASVQLSEKASELASKDKISLSEASSRMLKENPDLAKAYDEESRA